MVPIVSTIINGLTSLIAPDVCHVCGNSLTANEDVICLHCLFELPRTYVHHSDFNEIHRRLGHHVKVDRAAGWFNYKKGTPYAQLLVDAKYRNLPHIDYRLGYLCAEDLKRDSFFDGIDTLVPMPMHWLKRLLRGYNQAFEICRGISQSTSIPIKTAIKASKAHGVQARHNKKQRYTSITNTFDISDASAVNGKNILLVDDIITSGASCIEALRVLAKANPNSINVLSLGLTTSNT